MTLRDMRKMRGPNDGSRSLFESVMVPEVVKALKDWIAGGGTGVLIGGVALSYYVTPRYTQDVDFLFLDANAIPESVRGFKRHRSNAFEHRETGVEIEAVSPGNVTVPIEVIERIVEAAVDRDGVRVASPSGLVAGKLFRFKTQDRADIEALIEHGKIDLTGFKLPQPILDRYIGLLAEMKDQKEE